MITPLLTLSAEAIEGRRCVSPSLPRAMRLRARRRPGPGCRSRSLPCVTRPCRANFCTCGRYALFEVASEEILVLTWHDQTPTLRSWRMVSRCAFHPSREPPPAPGGASAAPPSGGHVEEATPSVVRALL